jgi:hypothetical protein
MRAGYLLSVVCAAVCDGVASGKFDAKQNVDKIVEEVRQKSGGQVAELSRALRNLNDDGAGASARDKFLTDLETQLAELPTGPDVSEEEDKTDEHIEEEDCCKENDKVDFSYSGTIPECSVDDFPSTCPRR